VHRRVTALSLPAFGSAALLGRRPNADRSICCDCDLGHVTGDSVLASLPSWKRRSTLRSFSKLHIGGIVLPEPKRNTNIGVGLGIVLQIVGRILSNDGMNGIGFIAILAGFVLFIWGCGQYAKGKGYSPWFGLLGLLSILGLIVLVFFKDKHKDA
jgi:hypothetical protein